MPRPPCGRVVRLTCENISKMLDSCSGGMPIPVSVTVTTALVPARSMVIQIWPLFAVYRQALLTRLLKT